MPISPSGTISVFFARPIVRLLADRGLDADEFFGRFGITRRAILEGESRISAHEGVAMLEALIALVDDPSIGLSLARFTDYESFGPLAAMFVAGGRLGDVFTLCARYSTLITDVVEVVYRDRDGVASLTIVGREGFVPHPQAMLLTIAVVRDFVRMRLRGTRPTKIFLRDVDESCRVVAAKYFDCAVEIGDSFRIEYPSDTSHEVLAGSDVEMADVIARTLDARLDRRERATVSQELVGWLERHLASGEPTIDKAATAFRTTPRSLQRRLKAEHVTWQKLVDDTRRKLAERYVLEPDLSFTEVSYRLGFADLSSFSRSFRKWYGVSASDFRSSGRVAGRASR